MNYIEEFSGVLKTSYSRLVQMISSFSIRVRRPLQRRGPGSKQGAPLQCAEHRLLDRTSRRHQDTQRAAALCVLRWRICNLSILLEHLLQSLGVVQRSRVRGPSLAALLAPSFQAGFALLELG